MPNVAAACDGSTVWMQTAQIQAPPPPDPTKQTSQLSFLPPTTQPANTPNAQNDDKRNNRHLNGKLLSTSPLPRLYDAAY